MSPPSGRGVITETWFGRGDSLEDYGSIIRQVATYLSDIKPREITNTDILQLEDFIKYLYDISKENHWKRGVKIIIKRALSKVSSLAYIVTVDRRKRSSDKFFNTVTELSEIMELLNSQI